MNVQIYCPVPSNGARELVRALEAKRVRNAEGIDLNIPTIIWGGSPGFQIPRSINNAQIGNKFQQATKLAGVGVSTIKVSLNIPEEPNNAAMDEIRREMREFVMMAPALESVVYQTAMRNLASKLSTPPMAKNLKNWLPRINTHVGGDDLLDPPGAPNFYAKREEIVKEIRVHSFRGKSIRAGMKKLRDGWTLGASEADYDEDRQVAHPWVRSYDAGWRISYDGVSATQPERDIAHAAVKALGLQFGAVDVATRPDGSLFVLEVNRAPGLEGGTITAYKEAFTAWFGEL